MEFKTSPYIKSLYQSTITSPIPFFSSPLTTPSKSMFETQIETHRCFRNDTECGTTITQLPITTPPPSTRHSNSSFDFRFHHFVLYKFLYSFLARIRILPLYLKLSGRLLHFCPGSE